MKQASVDLPTVIAHYEQKLDELRDRKVALQIADGEKIEYLYGQVEHYRKSFLFWRAYCVVVIVLATLFGIIDAARGSVTKPEHLCPTVQACRTELAHARAAIVWQRKARRDERAKVFRRDAPYAISLASRAFGVDYWQMWRVASCESHLGTQRAPEPSSHASGLFQFLPSTWQHTPFARLDIFDPIANALAAAQIVKHDGGWRQWTCKP